jgi:hypothetical protein
VGVLLFLPRGHLRKVEGPGAAELFWRAERGESFSPEEIQKLLQQVSDTDAINYPPLVALLLIYGKLPEAVPPMVYIHRLRQIETPCAKAYLGRLAWHTGEIDKAWTYWKEAKDCPESSLFLAWAYLQQGQSDSACALLNKSLAIPSAARSYWERLRAQAKCP